MDAKTYNEIENLTSDLKKLGMLQYRSQNINRISELLLEYQNKIIDVYDARKLISLISPTPTYRGFTTVPQIYCNGVDELISKECNENILLDYDSIIGDILLFGYNMLKSGSKDFHPMLDSVDKSFKGLKQHKTQKIITVMEDAAFDMMEFFNERICNRSVFV